MIRWTAMRGGPNMPRMTTTEHAGRAAQAGATLAAFLQSRLDAHADAAQRLALSLRVFAAPLVPDGAARRAERFGVAEAEPFYPCSVVKLFWLAACQRRLAEGAIAPHGELDRAMRDMIRWSSNTATNYIIERGFDAVARAGGTRLRLARRVEHFPRQSARE